MRFQPGNLSRAKSGNTRPSLGSRSRRVHRYDSAAAAHPRQGRVAVDAANSRQAAQATGVPKLPPAAP
jgi:hypothetical protein